MKKSFIIWFVFSVFAMALTIRVYNDYTSDFARVNRALRAYKAGKMEKNEYNFICESCNYPTWCVK